MNMLAQTLSKSAQEKHADQAHAMCRNERDYYDIFDKGVEEEEYWTDRSEEDVLPQRVKGRKDRFLTGRPECIIFKNTQEGCAMDCGNAGFLRYTLGAYNAGESQQALADSMLAPQPCRYHQPMFSTEKLPRSIIWCNNEFL